MERKSQILVAEDDADINELLKALLEEENYEVTSAYSGTEAKLCINMKNFDLVLLDLMLPGMSGETLIEEIRKNRKMPIIVISAKPGMETRLQTLKLGADDFIAKPFDNAEVLARVEAQLRRYLEFSKEQVEMHKLVYKNLKINLDTMRASVKGQEVNLTVREINILKLMISYPNKVFTRANLFESIWQQDYFGDDNTVNVHISNIRSKLAKADAGTDYIETVWGIGFKMHE